MLLTAPSILVAPGRRLSCAVSVSPEIVLYNFRPRVGLVRRAGQLFTDLARDAVQHLVKFVVYLPTQIKTDNGLVALLATH